MIKESDFRPAWWLKNPHAQTLYPTLRRRVSMPEYSLERLELADGDFLDLAWANANKSCEAPLVILLHGLGGGMNSPYVAGLMQAFNARGWRTALLYFRGASPEPNRLARAYHSGETADLNYVLRLLAAREPQTSKAVVGVSLGGNVLLKWLGEQGAQSLIDAAVAVSVPFQLHIAADRLSRGFSRVYQRQLLRKLKAIFAEKRQCFTNDLMPILEAMAHCQCFWTFDDCVTAPLHGFSHVHAYYREASSRRYLSNIATKTLIIHAVDDPFMTPEAIPRASELPAEVSLELSKAGGHVGFISGRFPGLPHYWLEERIPHFLQTFLN